MKKNGKLKLIDSEFSICKRYPPVSSPLFNPANPLVLDSIYLQPKTKKDDYCGEWGDK